MAKTLKDILESFDFNRAAISKQRLQNLRHSGRKVRGASVANLMRAAGLREEELDETELDQLDEVLSKDASASDWISDFVHSTNPKFEGKSKKERINMALGAYYDTHKKKDGVSEAYQSYSGPSHGHAYGGSGFGRREREDDEGYSNDNHKPMYPANNPTNRPQHPVAPVPDKKYIKGTPENKAHKAANKPINGHPTVKEEAEQIDELKKSTLGSYINKASKDARYSGQIATDFEHKAKKARSTSMKDASKSLAASFKSKAWKRDDGVAKAVSRLTKEEAEMNEAKDTVTKDASGKVTSWKHEGDWKKQTVKKNPEGKVHNLVGQALEKTKQMSKEEFEQFLEEATKQYAGLEKEDKPGKIKTAVVQQHPNGVGSETVEGWKDSKKPVKEEYDEDGNLTITPKSYTDFIAEMDFVGGKYVHKGTYGYAGKGAKYGNTDYDHEDLEKKDDEGESNQQQKRGRGRPAGAKSGARGPRIK